MPAIKMPSLAHSINVISPNLFAKRIFLIYIILSCAANIDVVVFQNLMNLSYKIPRLVALNGHIK